MAQQLATATCLLVKDETHATPYPALVYPIYDSNGNLDTQHLGGINLYGESEWYDLEMSIEFHPTRISNELKQYLLRCYHHLKKLNWFAPYQLADVIQITDQTQPLDMNFSTWFRESCQQYRIFPVYTQDNTHFSYVWKDYVLTASLEDPHPLGNQPIVQLRFRYTCPIEEVVYPNQYDFLLLESHDKQFKVKKVTQGGEQYQSILAHYQSKTIDFSSVSELPFVTIKKEVQQLNSHEQLALFFEHELLIELALDSGRKLDLMRQLSQFWKQLLFKH